MTTMKYEGYVVRERCVSAKCNDLLEMTADRYEQSGNYCSKCCGKAQVNAGPKILRDPEGRGLHKELSAIFSH